MYFTYNQITNLTDCYQSNSFTTTSCTIYDPIIKNFIKDTTFKLNRLLTMGNRQHQIVLY